MIVITVIRLSRTKQLKEMIQLVYIEISLKVHILVFDTRPLLVITFFNLSEPPTISCIAHCWVHSFKTYKKECLTSPVIFLPLDFEKKSTYFGYFYC